MRRTVLDRDAAEWTVFLNGFELLDCVEADDQLGWAKFISRHHQTGERVFGADGEPDIVEGWGRVEFRLRDHDPRSTKEKHAAGALSPPAAPALPNRDGNSWYFVSLAQPLQPFVGLPNTGANRTAIHTQLQVSLSPARLCFPGWVRMQTAASGLPSAATVYLDRFAPGLWQLTVDGEGLGAYEWFGIDQGKDELRIWLRPVHPECDGTPLFGGRRVGDMLSPGWAIGVKQAGCRWGWESTYAANSGGTFSDGLHEYLYLTAGEDGDLADTVRFLNEELAREAKGLKF